MVAVVPGAGAGENFLTDTHKILKNATDKAAENDDLPPFEVFSGESINHDDGAEAVDDAEGAIEDAASGLPEKGAVTDEMGDKAKNHFVVATKDATDNENKE